MYKKNKQNFKFIFFDIIALYISFYISLLLRYGGNIPTFFKFNPPIDIIILLIIKILVFSLTGLYRHLWKYASIDEMFQIVFSVITANLITYTYIYLAKSYNYRNISIQVAIIDLLIIGASRLFIRVLHKMKNKKKIKKSEKRILLIGAGAAGVIMLREIRNNENVLGEVIGFIDDDIEKQEKNINGIKVLGNRTDIKRICKEEEVDLIIVTMPSVALKEVREILHICKETDANVKMLPSISDLIYGDIELSQIRDVKIEDLLGREEINLELSKLSDFLKGKRVMVTGGGGSIGSELCRQIARYNPESLLILDIYENNAYEIQNELLRDFSSLNLKTYIASIRDETRLDKIFEREKPQVIFHAAAHKHVPLMEFNPQEAIKNNVFGTFNTARVACRHNVEKFVLISTDKAVNPTNVMGATKRVCEMIVQSLNTKSKTDFVAVRFGNVLGSNGSVIPLFKKQIESGGPVTVTDERINRFFMTIPEACQLVLEAGSMAHGGEIFVLDMGEPVKIIDLAKDLIKLSGLEPNVDIDIEIIGLRPGEKLYEEILINPDDMNKTKNDKIYIEKSQVVDYSDLCMQLDKLKNCVKTQDKELIKKTLSEVVPTYKIDKEKVELI